MIVDFKLPKNPRKSQGRKSKGGTPKWDSRKKFDKGSARMCHPVLEEVLNGKGRVVPWSPNIVKVDIVKISVLKLG